MNPYILRTVVHLDQPGRDISWSALACIGNANAHRVEVEVRERGAMIDLTGAQVMLYAYRSDGETVLVEGEIGSDGRAGATLSEPCYARDGKLACTLTIMSGGVVLAAARVFLVIKAAYGGAVIDPGETLPTLEDMLAQTAAIEQAIKDAKAATAAANAVAAGKVDIAQGEGSAGKLLYVGDDGNVTVLTLGDGLEIVGGELQGGGGGEGSGVYVGSTEPTDEGVNVWIDPDAETQGTITPEDTTFYETFQTKNLLNMPDTTAENSTFRVDVADNMYTLTKLA